MKRILLALVPAGPSGAVMAADALPGLPATKTASGAEIYIISPKDGATVDRDVSVRLGLKGVGVAPTGVAREPTGRHHLRVDVKGLPAAG